MTTLTQEQVYDALEALQEAQEKLQETIDALERYHEITEDIPTKVYLTDHLRIMLDGNHGFLSQDLSIEQVIGTLIDREEQEAEIFDLVSYLNEGR